MGLRTEELRLALVMNGGVSLAVWMGGVTNEIFRLVRERHPVYSGLLDMTRTDARVDVISGTSAGGVNGAALAVAMIYGGDFERLRDVWLKTGAFDDLLRQPTEDNPGSLLRGDDFFLPNIERALSDLVPHGAAPADPDDLPVELQLTTTLMTGWQGNNVDDIGTQLHDVDYRARFRFSHRTKAASPFMRPANIMPILARAARSTASFPFAFEPSMVSTEAAAYLYSASGVPLADPRYVLDGGVLDNKPFGGVREAMFSMAATRSVRRVLAYINPDPGDGPVGKAGGDLPPLSRVLVEGILNIPQSQTIADQLAAIDAHNLGVRAKRDSVATLAGLLAGPSDRLENLAASLYPVYRRRRLRSTFELFVFQPLSDAARPNSAAARGLRATGKSGRRQMLHAFMRYGDEEAGGWLPDEWPDADDTRSYERATWSWGLFPVEFGAKILLDMLRLAQKFVEADRGDPPPLPPAPAPAATALGGSDWSDRGWSRDRVAAERATPSSDPRDAQLGVLWKATNELLRALESMRAVERKDHWKPSWERLLADIAEKLDHGPDSAGWLETLRAEYRAMFAFLTTADRRGACFDHATTIARLVGTLATLVAPWTNKPPGRAGVDDSAHERLRGLARTFAPVAGRPVELLRIVMRLEVCEFAFTDHEELNKAINIELVQISGNSESPLGGPRDAKDKLLGLQLAHFGAFFKRSWRANDWLQGRLAGSERLVRILLDPERLYRVFAGASDAAARHVRALAIDSVASPRLRARLLSDWEHARSEAAIARELAYLDHADYLLPDALPCTTAAVTRRLHYGILEEELPRLVDAIHADQAAGAAASGPGEAIRRDLFASERPSGSPVSIAPEQARRWLENGLVAGETVLGEAGSDLFTATLAKTAATLQGTIASKGARLGPVSALFASVKLPVLGFYFASKGLVGQSRTSAALNGGALALGLAIVLLQFFFDATVLGKDGPPHALVAIGWALLAYGAIVCMLRQTWITVACAAIGLGVVATWIALRQPIGTDVFVLLGGLLLFCIGMSVRELQAIGGVAAFAVAALWGSGWFGVNESSRELQTIAGQGSGRIHSDVLVFATVILVALLLAMVQSSERGARLEKRIDAFVRRGRTPMRDVRINEVLLSIASRGWFPHVVEHALVKEVAADSAAARGGLLAGDELTLVDGISVHVDENELLRLFSKAARLTVTDRNGASHDIGLT